MKKILLSVLLLSAFGANAAYSYTCGNGLEAVIDFPSLTIIKDGITIASDKSDYEQVSNENADIVENLIVRVGEFKKGTDSEFILVHTGDIKNGLLPIFDSPDDGGKATLLIGGHKQSDKAFKCSRLGFNSKGEIKS